MADSSKGYTVWHAFYDVLRRYGMTTVFGNPGSTEQPMLKNFPSDFQYIFGLQEASVVGMAGGFSEATGRPVPVSLHTSAGTGNAMGTIVSAFITKIPLVIIAGQQTREMLLGEPMLANRSAVDLPKPYIKWSYEPVRAVDVPAALIRAICVATQPPQGPVYLSIPLDDWNVEMTIPVLPRSVSTRFGPDPNRLEFFAERIRQAHKVALVLGAEVDKSGAWDAALRLAEKLHSPVFQAPMVERAVFPETHELYKGPLPTARGPLAQYLESFDTVLVIGAEVFRYYPWVAGPVLKEGSCLLQITNDPNDAAKALMGDSMLSDVGLALEGLCQLFDADTTSNSKQQSSGHEHHSHVDRLLTESKPSTTSSGLMTAYEAFAAVAELRPPHSILVHETPSNTADLCKAWKTTEPASWFTFASGGLGWNGPAAVGVALAQRAEQTGRLTVLAIGDGSFQYSLQSVYTAVQHKVKLIYLVPVNDEYAILKEFAELEECPGVPGLDLPGLDISASARAFGCPAFRANSRQELQEAFKEALDRDGPTLIEFPIDRTLRPLIAQTTARC